MRQARGRGTGGRLPWGSSAYMEIWTPCTACMREGGSLSGAYLQVDPAALDDALPAASRRSRRWPGWRSPPPPRELPRRSWPRTSSSSSIFNVVFAAIIAFGVVYNAARISLSERSRELASLRVLGFTLGEISLILLGELALLTLLAHSPGAARRLGPVDVDILTPSTARSTASPSSSPPRTSPGRAHRARRLAHLGPRGPPQARPARPGGRPQDPGVDAMNPLRHLRNRKVLAVAGLRGSSSCVMALWPAVGARGPRHRRAGRRCW